MSWNIWVYIIIGVLMLSFVVIKRYFPSVKDDGMVEEEVEKVIKDTTGIDCDLTPGSPEAPKVDTQEKQ